MNDLTAMNQRMQTWLNEKNQWSGIGNELSPKSRDLVLFQFVANGDDGDRYIKAYRTHAIDAKSKNGKDYTTHRYCPIQSGEVDKPCTYCQQGHTTMKERFSVWLYVDSHFHAQPMADKPLPQVNYNNTLVFQEKIDGFRIWHTSAWRESPWGDINKLYDLYKGLHNFTAELSVVGAERETRYKVYPLPNSPSLPKEIYERASEECESIGKLLEAQLGSSVTINSAPQQSLGNVPVFTPTFATPAPSNGDYPLSEIVIKPEEDPRRPMQSLF